MYNPKYINLEADVYQRCVATAKAYYSLLKRRREIENDIIHAGISADGQPRGNRVSNPTAQKAEKILMRQEENERKIRAVERANDALSDDCQREFIRLNFYEGIPIHHINLPMTTISMKRVRKRFLVALAENLNEI